MNQDNDQILVYVNVSSYSNVQYLTGVPVEKCVSSPYGVVLPQRQRLNDLPEFQRGYFEIQDEASQIAALKVQVCLQISYILFGMIVITLNCHSAVGRPSLRRCTRRLNQEKRY